MSTPIEHGTYKGFIRCRWLPDGPCSDCQKARNEYMKDWRKRSPSKYRQNLDSQQIRDKALRILGRRHRAELTRIIENLKREEAVS